MQYNNSWLSLSVPSRAAGVGKRKRSDECPRLSALASADVPAEVSCIHAIETQEGVTASP